MEPGFNQTGTGTAATAETASALRDTFPRQLLRHAAERPHAPAIREKDLGIWQTWSWQQTLAEVRALACGLAAQGLGRGDHLAIIGDNRPRLYWSMLAAQCLGAIPVPLYQDAVAQEMVYVLEDAEVSIVVAENQEQVDKMLEILPQCPHLKHIVYDDGRGLRHYAQPQLLSYARLQDIGRAYDETHHGFFERCVEDGLSNDVAVMLYTSGTTGRPKGVCQTHGAFLAAGRGGVASENLGPGDEVLSYLPMAWVGDHLFSYAQALVGGMTVNCPESSETVMTDMREIGPTYYFAPPRVFENLLTQVMIRMEDGGYIQRRLFHYFMSVARRCGTQVLDRKTAGPGVPRPEVSLTDRILYLLGDILIYGPLRNVLGMSRIRVGVTAGAAIGPDLFRFYRSIGVNLKQFYGSTETCAYGCMQPDGLVKFDTVGPPGPGVQVRISPNGEVLMKSSSLLKEYYKRPDATAEIIDADGYFHTGDAGSIDSDGHLKIIDRAKDVGKLAQGAMFAPNYIENKLKFSPHIKEAVAFGDRRERVCAFINIDMHAVGDWAERRNLAYSGYTDLAGQADTYELICACVESVNQELAQDPLLCDSQIHRFLILHKELDPDDDELTRTRKVRRGFIAEKYRILIDALYSDAEHQFIETQVKFEDGRSGSISANLRICNVKTFAGHATRNDRLAA